MESVDRVETNKVEDKNRIKMEIADEVEERREQYQQTYTTLMAEYETSLINYKEQLKTKVLRLCSDRHHC